MEIDKLRVAVLGSGMAGLLACKGLVDTGVLLGNIDILTRSTELQLSPGLHYLHDNCGLDIKKLTVYNYIIPDENSAEPPHLQYSKKVGNPENNSVKDLKSYEVVYDMQEAHQILHSIYVSRMKIKNITSSKLASLKSEYDLVVSTLPLYMLYPHAKCEKTLVEVVADEVPESVDSLYYNHVTYNLRSNDKWYRSSSVNGRKMTEVLPGYSDGKTVKIQKLIDTDYVHTDDKVLLVGRYGTWNRKYLAHQSYYDTAKFIKDYYLWEGYYG